MFQLLKSYDSCESGEQLEKRVAQKNSKIHQITLFLPFDISVFFKLWQGLEHLPKAVPERSGGMRRG